jgi:hypothetical protein
MVTDPTMKERVDETIWTIEYDLSMSTILCPIRKMVS